ncbi:MAG: aminoglycoside phosphotransferase family protein, partial [Chitinophagaceae bacterium]|nr:aminoglycoside phosphotransferase family protein [Chitinophagaceae bacterium]
MVEAAMKAFGLDTDVHTSSLFGSGLIHNTYIIKDKEGAPAYILQKVNHFVFKKPEDIAHNLKLMGSYISHFHPDYLFTQPHATLKGEDYYYTPEEGYFRLFEFIKGTHTADVCRTALQA